MGFTFRRIRRIALVRSLRPTFAAAGTTACATGSRAAFAFAWNTRTSIPLGTTRALAFSTLRSCLPAIVVAFARPVGLPFLLADDAVTVGVQLVEQLAVTAFPFSFLRMQSPCEAQHGNDSNGNDFHTFFLLGGCFA